MKFEVKRGLPTGWTELIAAPVDFDGTPAVPSLRIWHPLGEGSSDRIAVVAALAFAPWIAGRCDFEAQISALTAERFSAFFRREGVWAAPSPVRSGGLPIPSGARQAALNCPVERDELEFSVPAGELAHSVAPTRVVVASNAHFLRQQGAADGFELLPQLAVATLLAEELSVGRIRYPILAERNAALFQSASELLECVSIGLVP